MPLVKKRAWEALGDEAVPKPKKRRESYRQMDNIGFRDDQHHALFRELPCDLPDVLKEIGMHMVAMLNTTGGVMFYGVRPSGTIYGERINRKEQDNLKNIIDDTVKRIIPSVRLDMYRLSFIPVDGGPCDRVVLKISVKLGDPVKLYEDAHHNAYVRKGTRLVGPLTPHQIKDITIKQINKEILHMRTLSEAVTSKAPPTTTTTAAVPARKGTSTLIKSSSNKVVKSTVTIPSKPPPPSTATTSKSAGPTASSKPPPPPSNTPKSTTSIPSKPPPPIVATKAKSTATIPTKPPPPATAAKARSSSGKAPPPPVASSSTTTIPTKPPPPSVAVSGKPSSAKSVSTVPSKPPPLAVVTRAKSTIPSKPPSPTVVTRPKSKAASTPSTAASGKTPSADTISAIPSKPLPPSTTSVKPLPSSAPGKPPSKPVATVASQLSTSPSKPATASVKPTTITAGTVKSSISAPVLKNSSPPSTSSSTSAVVSVPAETTPSAPPTSTVTSKAQSTGSWEATGSRFGDPTKPPPPVAHVAPQPVVKPVPVEKATVMKVPPVCTEKSAPVTAEQTRRPMASITNTVSTRKVGTNYNQKSWKVTSAKKPTPTVNSVRPSHVAPTSTRPAPLLPPPPPAPPQYLRHYHPYQKMDQRAYQGAYHAPSRAYQAPPKAYQLQAPPSGYPTQAPYQVGYPVAAAYQGSSVPQAAQCTSRVQSYGSAGGYMYTRDYNHGSYH